MVLWLKILILNLKFKIFNQFLIFNYVGSIVALALWSLFAKVLHSGSTALSADRQAFGTMEPTSV
jgi:hypothetical protein